MNVLDENVVEGQRQLLRSWRIRVWRVGFQSDGIDQAQDSIVASAVFLNAWSR